MIDIQIPQTCAVSPFKDDRHEWSTIAGKDYAMFATMAFRLLHCKHCKLLVLIHGPVGEGFTQSAPTKKDQVLFMIDGRDFVK